MRKLEDFLFWGGRFGLSPSFWHLVMVELWRITIKFFCFLDRKSHLLAGGWTHKKLGSNGLQQTFIKEARGAGYRTKDLAEKFIVE